jgi:hypothetical protein
MRSAPYPPPPVGRTFRPLTVTGPAPAIHEAEGLVAGEHTDARTWIARAALETPWEPRPVNAHGRILRREGDPTHVRTTVVTRGDRRMPVATHVMLRDPQTPKVS